MFLGKRYCLQFLTYLGIFILLNTEESRGIKEKAEQLIVPRYYNYDVASQIHTCATQNQSMLRKSKHAAEFPTGIIPQRGISFCDKQTIALVTDRGNNSTAFLELCPQGKMRLLLMEFDSIQVHVHFIKEKLVGVSLVLDYIKAKTARFSSTTDCIFFDNVEKILHSVRFDFSFDTYDERLGTES